MLLTANARYDKFASAFEGFEGYHAETPEQIKSAFRAALKETKKPSIINIAINPFADRKSQVLNSLINFYFTFIKILFYFRNFRGFQNHNVLF